jgi:hypothetical protein
MKSEWINKSKKGFLLRKNNGVLIDKFGNKLNYSEINVLTWFFDDEYKPFEYAIVNKLVDYKVYEFILEIKHREVF